MVPEGCPGPIADGAVRVEKQRQDRVIERGRGDLELPSPWSCRWIGMIARRIFIVPRMREDLIVPVRVEERRENDLTRRRR